MIICEKEIVIHTNYGGFHFDDEMALWLCENRNWTLSKNYDENCDLYDMGHDYLALGKDKNEKNIRHNQDLIDCVKALQFLHKDDEWQERRERHIHNLSVVKVKVHLDVEDEYDGIEKVKCWVEQVED